MRLGGKIFFLFEHFELLKTMRISIIYIIKQIEYLLKLTLKENTCNAQIDKILIYSLYIVFTYSSINKYNQLIHKLL